MKTIFITNFHLIISRNILATDILRILRENDTRVVIIVPEQKKEYFQKTYGGENVIVEGIKANQPSRSKTGLVFKRLSHAMLNTESVRLYNYNRKFFLHLIFLQPLK